MSTNTQNVHFSHANTNTHSRTHTESVYTTVMQFKHRERTKHKQQLRGNDGMMRVEEWCKLMLTSTGVASQHQPAGGSVIDAELCAFA